MNGTVSLTADLARFVAAEVEMGRYASSGDIFREALRLLEHRERTEADKLAWLREAWRDGVESGSEGAFDPASFKEEARRRLAAQA